MCNIRIIIKNKEKQIINDFVKVISNLEINIIDRPAFCIFVDKDNNDFFSLEFKFSNLREDKIQISSKDKTIDLEIGKVSGCIYFISFKRDDFKKKLSELINLESIKQNVTKRYVSNLNNFSKLSILIITDVLKNEDDIFSFS